MTTQDIFQGESYRCKTGCNTLLRMLKSQHVVEVQQSVLDIDEKHASTIIENKHHCTRLEGHPTMSQVLFTNTTDMIEARAHDKDNGYIWPNKY